MEVDLLKEKKKEKRRKINEQIFKKFSLELLCVITDLVCICSVW